jgi:hypothetical protein
MLSQFFIRFFRPSIALGVLLATPAVALQAQRSAAQGYVAAIAYSQSTGKIGYSAAQVRTEQAAKDLALQNCGAPDAKVWMWAQNEWVAIAVAEGPVGTAGFARGKTWTEAEQRALAECQTRAKGRACRVALCVHSQGSRPRTLLAIAADPKLPPPAPTESKPQFFAAIAYSPSTGKIGSTAGEARTKEAAQQLALKNCGARDAKVFMWGNEWVAMAVVEGRTGAAGFGPGATREVAEKNALAEARKYAHGAPVRLALAIHSAGKQGVTAAKQAVAGPGASNAQESAAPAPPAAASSSKPSAAAPKTGPALAPPTQTQ